MYVLRYPFPELDKKLNSQPLARWNRRQSDGSQIEAKGQSMAYLPTQTARLWCDEKQYNPDRAGWTKMFSYSAMLYVVIDYHEEIHSPLN